jgi:spatacsin
LGWPLAKLLNRTTTEYLESPLSATIAHWKLVEDVVLKGRMTNDEVASCLARFLYNWLVSRHSLGLLRADNFGEQFLEFARLSRDPKLLGDHLIRIFHENRMSLILHAVLCHTNSDVCAGLLDSLMDPLVEAKDVGLIADVVSILPDPVLVQRYVEYLIRESKLDYLPRNEQIGWTIMSVARHVRPFDPQAYFDLTLRYKLYRDHAELQLEFATMNALRLDYPAARKHFLLTLSYFLHENCYSLSLECLKKFAVVSLPYNLKLPILGLDPPTVMQLIQTRDFHFALTMALYYDLDNDKTWADAIYNQVIRTNVDVFLKASVKVK